MGLFDKAKDAMGQNSDKVDQGVDQAGDFAKDKVGEEHADKVDKASDAAKDQLGGGDGGNQ